LSAIAQISHHLINSSRNWLTEISLKSAGLTTLFFHIAANCRSHGGQLRDNEEAPNHSRGP
jgi:hypothetical protein